MQFETLLFEKRERVGVITLNRPERLNAINTAMSRELPLAWQAIMRDPEIVVAILTGAGDRALCTGFDMVDFSSGRTAVGDPAEAGRLSAVRFTALQNGCWKPVITAVNGMATGGGMHFVAGSDLVVAAEHAEFFENHVRVGLMSGLEPVSLLRRMPLEAVMRLSLLGGAERMSARRAYELGLVGDVVPRDQVMPRALDLAEKIARNSPAALMASKRSIWESLDRGLADALENTWSIMQKHTGHPDASEGPRAFVEKRAPAWRPIE
jgi:enoyl-CoA hydratase/carnithine racemase